MSACGIHISRAGLVAVVVNAIGRPMPHLRIRRADGDRLWLVTLLSTPAGDYHANHLVVPESLLALDPIANEAASLGLIVWTTPDWLLHALAAATATSQRPSTRATILARLPTISVLRPYLRPSSGFIPNQPQLSLFDPPQA